MVKKRIIWIFIVLLLLVFSSCTNVDEENKSDVEILSTVLFMPEDLDDGWYTNTYLQHTSTSEFDPETPSVKAISAFIQAESGSLGAGKNHPSQPSRYHAGQGLFEYQNETDAILAAENVREFITAYQIDMKPFNIAYAPQLNIIQAGCRRAQGPEIGYYDSCMFDIQHGLYISRSNMVVDGELITMEDWEDFINAIQVKLIEQVAKENEP